MPAKARRHEVFEDLFNFIEPGKLSKRVREGIMKSTDLRNKRGSFSAEKMSTVLLKMSSEGIRVYLWFLRFSNYLLRLVQ
jgi:hypothetical protein